MSTRVLMVDWLGRGGIAQATESWALELGAHGYDVGVVTRPGRELGQGVTDVYASKTARGRVGAHRAVVDAATRRIRELRPDWVVVQNYVVPLLERPIFRAAQDVDANVAVVVHNDHVHTRAAGNTVGLGRNLAEADVLVAHSTFVGHRLTQATGRTDVVVVPLPVPLGMIWHERAVPAPLRAHDGGDPWCGHFGILNRRYKGTDVVERLASEGRTSWRFAIFGTGAGRAETDRVARVDGFLEPGMLAGAVSATDVTLAPYTTATQSAVVVLAHALGSVPIATAVGGIPEQISTGVDGILVAPGSDLSVWRSTLDALRDDSYRKDLAAAGESRAWADHRVFVDGVVGLLR